MTCAKEQGCWCSQFPDVVPMPTEPAGCLCPKCLQAEIDRIQQTDPQGATKSFRPTEVP
jgi:hypothetical protein